MSAVADFIHHYRGFWDSPAKCRIRVYRLASGMTVIVATELPDNEGTCITNYAEHLATEIRTRFVSPGDAMVWIEHYPDRDFIDDVPEHVETFDQVFFR